MQNVAAPFTWNLEPLSVVVPTNIFPVLTGFNITFLLFPAPSMYIAPVTE
jgi:hypothetical protein